MFPKMYWLFYFYRWCHHITWVSWILWQQPWLDLVDSSTNGTNNRNKFSIFWCRIRIYYLWVSWNSLQLSNEKYIQTNLSFQLGFLDHLWWCFKYIIHDGKVLWWFHSSQPCLFKQWGLDSFSNWLLCNLYWIQNGIQSIR